MSHKFLHYFSWVTLSLTAALICVLLFYTFWPYHIADIKNAPYPILNENKTVRSGELLKHEVDYCKYLEIGSDTSKQFINGLIYTVPTTYNDNPVGCSKTVFSTVIPPELPPGEYILTITKTYHVNPIRDIVFTNSTEKFTVIK
jgi:hypothetical protein